MDLISIIIPTYKGGNGIVECVNSALKQDYEAFEVIVVDDNGKGKAEQKQTEELLKQFQTDDKFRYIVHETNINGSAARNTGIRHSKGNYLAFLDDDDILSSDSIRLRYEKLSSMTDEFGIVFSSFEQFINGKKDFDCVYDFEGNILIEYLSEKIHSPSSILMIKRNVIDNIGLWDESFKRHQDWEFVTRVLNVYKACSIPQITVKRIVTWRNNAKNPELFEEQRMYFLRKMKDIINKQDELIQKRIYYIHYMDIGKNYLKYKALKKALVWTLKSKKPVHAIIDYLRGGFTYLKRFSLPPNEGNK